MTKEQLEGLGLTVHAELHNERINDHLFVIRDYDGDLMIIHSYLNGLDETPMVEFYLESAFTRREQRKLRRNPKAFLEVFDQNIVNAVPDWSETEQEFVDALTKYTHELEDGE